MAYCHPFFTNSSIVDKYDFCHLAHHNLDFYTVLTAPFDRPHSFPQATETFDELRYSIVKLAE